MSGWASDCWAPGTGEFMEGMVAVNTTGTPVYLTPEEAEELSRQLAGCAATARAVRDV